MALAAIVGPICQTQLFARFASEPPYIPGAPFFLSSLLTLGSLTIVSLATRGIRLGVAVAPSPSP